MTNDLRDFIESNIELIDTNNWRQLFINAYDEALLTSEVLDLHNMLLEADIVDSTLVRNDLLFEYIKSNLDFIRNKYKGADPDDMTTIECYAVQFLRHYLNNTFGFAEQDALQFMWENQEQFGIRLTTMDKRAGTRSVINYRIHYDN